MVEFTIGCRKCGKAITLRVRDESARHVFEETGALCLVCYRSSPAPVSAGREA